MEEALAKTQLDILEGETVLLTLHGLEQACTL